MMPPSDFTSPSRDPFSKQDAVAFIRGVCERHEGEVFLVATALGFETYARLCFEAFPKLPFFLAPGKEASKSLITYGQLLERLAAQRISRKGAIVGIGGGGLLDLAGFSAATYLRGIDYYACPTTLLSMVDAAIGGKTGLNLGAGKNLVGAFHWPKGIATDMGFLKSLPEREYASGMAEVIKMACLKGGSLWEKSQSNGSSDSNQSELESLISDCQAFKHHLTQADKTENMDQPIERSRMQLNFGHTLGHAIEKTTNYQLLHGEAVAIGMAFALELSCHYAGLAMDQKAIVINVLQGQKLPICPPDGIELECIIEALRHDKKGTSGALRWVLLEEIGKPRFFEMPIESCVQILSNFLSK
jgi:3-dehydroquinate synthase